MEYNASHLPLGFCFFFKRGLGRNGLAWTCDTLQSWHPRFGRVAVALLAPVGATRGKVV